MKKVLRVPDASGDREFNFDSGEADAAMAAARDAFAKARSGGGAVVSDGRTVHRFDELGAENVALRPIVAG